MNALILLTNKNFNYSSLSTNFNCAFIFVKPKICFLLDHT